MEEVEKYLDYLLQEYEDNTEKTKMHKNDVFTDYLRGIRCKLVDCIEIYAEMFGMELNRHFDDNGYLIYERL